MSTCKYKLHKVDAVTCVTDTCHGDWSYGVVIGLTDMNDIVIVNLFIFKYSYSLIVNLLFLII